MDYTYEQIAKMIDHSLLNPTLTVGELIVLRVVSRRFLKDFLTFGIAIPSRW